MDDEFLHSVRRQPSVDFARRLRLRLQHAEAGAAAPHPSRPYWRAATYAAAVVLAVGAFTFPSVRAGARAFLDLFRVVNFAPVAVQPERAKELANLALDVPAMLGKQVEVLKTSGPPQTVATPEAASAAAGMPVRLPAWRPVGVESSLIQVSGEHAMRVTANTESLKYVMDALAINDLQVPEELNGQTVTIRVPPVVRVTFVGNASGRSRNVTLLQARHPEVSFPSGTDLSVLAEIGLRVMGVERAEAHRFAQNVDWRTTLLVPVPADVALFRQVDVQGHAGLLIEQRPQGSQGPRSMESRLLWSSGDYVFALVGNVSSSELFEMAQSVQ